MKNFKNWLESKWNNNQNMSIHEPFSSVDYPPLPGLEGPWKFKDGRILYYDPKQGQYYDRKTDLYVDILDVRPWTVGHNGIQIK